MTVRNFFAEAKAEGIILGREQGLAEGLNMVFSFVEDGLVPLAEAARRANMSEDEFRARMRERSAQKG